MPLVPGAKVAQIHMETLAATQPANALETWLSDQIAHASWEMERVRVNSATAPEPDLNALYNRASRNWNRARKELGRLQSNRLRHITRLSPNRQKIAEAAPLADPSQPARSGPMAKYLMECIIEGRVAPEAIEITVDQRYR